MWVVDLRYHEFHVNSGNAKTRVSSSWPLHYVENSILVDSISGKTILYVNTTHNPLNMGSSPSKKKKKITNAKELRK